MFFPDQTPFPIEGTRQQPHSQGLLPFQNGLTDAENNDKLNKSKNCGSAKK